MTSSGDLAYISTSSYNKLSNTLFNKPTTVTPLINLSCRAHNLPVAVIQIKSSSIIDILEWLKVFKPTSK